MRKDQPMTGKRNPIAKAMLVSRETNCKPKVVKNKKAYNRKNKTRYDDRGGSYHLELGLEFFQFRALFSV